MAEYTADFNLGVDGNTITTGDTGSATAWSFVNLGGSATIKYDNDHLISGALAGKVTTAGDSGNIFLGWGSGVVGSITDYHGRFYLYATANPANEMLLHYYELSSAGPGQCWYLVLNTDGTLETKDAPGATIDTFTNAITLNAFIRVEYHIVHSSGDIEVKLFNDHASTSPTETQSATGQTLRASADTIYYGLGQLNYAVWFDSIIANATAYPGPYFAGQVARASADSVDGAWTDQSGGTSLAAAIDEALTSDSDYIRSEFEPSTSGCRVKLGTLTDPATSADHVIHWRAGKDATGGTQIDMTVKLYQGGGNSQGGGTLIADFVRTDVDAFTTYDETLSAGEASAITDYSDLYLEFYAAVA